MKKINERRNLLTEFCINYDLTLQVLGLRIMKKDSICERDLKVANGFHIDYLSNI